jgi:arylsulfatase A-like enzyme
MKYFKINILTSLVLCFVVMSSAMAQAELSWKAKWISTEQSSEKGGLNTLADGCEAESAIELGQGWNKNPYANIKPNIIFILADDLGYMDIQEYAHHTLGTGKDAMFYETPNIDRLINEGMAFERAYACPLCSPTRASILTGKNAARLGFTTATPFKKTYYNQGMEVPVGSYAHDVLFHGDKIKNEQALENGSTNTALPSGTDFDQGIDEISIAEALPDYHSAFIGKWHVGGHGAKGYTPADQGFDPIAWCDAGGSAYFNWRKEWNNRSIKNIPNAPQEEWLLGDAGRETGEEYLTDDLTAQALDYIDQRKQIYDQPFFLYFCHFAVHSPWQGKKEDVEHFEQKSTKGWNNHTSSTYASMILSLDESVGAIMAKLKETGLDDNTLIVFMSDNGGIDSKIVPHQEVTDNSPLMGGKACVTEGGIRVPLIFWWKGKIKAGQWSNIPVDCADILPTLVEAAGYDAKPFYDEVKIDGRSIFGLFFDAVNKKKTYKRDTRYWHYPFNVIYNNPYDNLPLTPHSAIMEGDYKLIFDWYGRLRLFNLNEDISEQNNLAKQLPEITNDLYNKLITWMDENVKETYWPKVNPDYNANNELHDAPFINLLEAYRKGENVARLAN